MNQPAQQQPVPGVQSRMDPVPDCGEQSYEGSGKLAGKAAVITGGDSGIGRAVAIAFAREGADVLISYLEEDEDAQDTARLVEEAGRRAVLVRGDLAEAQHCRDIITKAVEEFGKVDVLVSNAAYQMTHETVEEVSDDEWRHTFDTNVSAMFWLVKAALPHMSEGSSIIGSSSVNSDMPSPTLAPYAATKAIDRELHGEPRAAARTERHPRQQRRARPDLDAADPVDDAARARRGVRVGHAAGPSRTTSRARPGLRSAGERRRQLRVRRPRGRHRRSTHPLTPPPRPRGGRRSFAAFRGSSAASASSRRASSDARSAFGTYPA
jgi:NADP-dependent 3-hydroxy acid dehydrogenase YdfG